MRGSPISAKSRAARTVPARGRLVKMCASAWAASCSPIWLDRIAICSTRAVRVTTKARVMCTCAAPSWLVAPRGAAVSRACRVAGSVRPGGRRLSTPKAPQEAERKANQGCWMCEERRTCSKQATGWECDTCLEIR